MIRSILFIMAAIALQQCTNLQSNSSANNSTNMDNTQKENSLKKQDNPIYSKTDTSKVTLSEEEWKKLLPKDVYNIARQKGTERPWTSKLKTFMKSELITVLPAATPCFKVIQNLKVVVAGQAFMNLSVKQVSLIQSTTRMAW